MSGRFYYGYSFDDIKHIKNLIKDDCIHDITDPELLHVIISRCTKKEFNIIKKLNLSGVCFDGINVKGFDFTGSKGAKINPQTVGCKSLQNTTLSGVEIIGSFDSVDIEGTDFTGSKGAKINPQTVECKSLAGTTLNGVEIIGSLDGVDIEGTDFTGSLFAKMEQRKVKYNVLKQIILNEFETNSSNLEQIKILKKSMVRLKKIKNKK